MFYFNRKPNDPSAKRYILKFEVSCFLCGFFHIFKIFFSSHEMYLNFVCVSNSQSTLW